MSDATSISDVFLSYSRADAPAVEALRARLAEAGIKSFLDRARLPAGQPWQPFLERELRHAGAVAVFLGQRMGSWQHREVQVALDRQAREQGFPVIPILLPGLDDEPKGFLALQTWIDLRADPDDPLQLRNLIAAIHREPPEGAAAVKAGICPYRGLLPFREEDAALFFGRDDWTLDLTAKAQTHPLVAVVGRSGSGKSSLVYAGLFPALRRSPGGTTWDMLAIRPGHEPLHALAAALSPPPEDATPAARLESINADADRLRRGAVGLDQLVRHHLGQQRGTDRLLLYVDQWEELYTLAAPPEGETSGGTGGQSDRPSDAPASAERQRTDVARFIDLLLAATAGRSNALTVVLTVRADFYDHLLRHPTLPTAIQGHQLNLGPMTRAQLRQCIEGPAAAVGLRFEGNLVESILDEVGEDEGKLPLLEYALRGTWEASRKAWQDGAKPGLLTFAAYNGVKGVGGAIGTRAEQIYARLDESERQAARRLFVSLVTPGEGQEDTRARATIPNDRATAEVVRRFSDSAARLLVTGWDQSRGERLAEVSHEALIRNWETLREWIAANREVLRTRERIRGQMKHWEEEKEPDDLLLQPGRALEEGRQLLSSHGDVLIDDVRPYVERSIDHDQRLLEAEQRGREETQRKELERERQLRETQELTTRRTRLGLIAASFLFLIAAGAGAYGWWQQGIAAHTAGELEVKNRDLQAAKRKALAQESRALAALAQREAKAGNAVDGMLLALRGMPVADVEEPRPVVTETRQALFDAMLRQREQLVLRGHKRPVNTAGFSPDGARIVSGSGGFDKEDNTVRVWDAASGQQLLVLRGHEEKVSAAAFSPDGARIVSGSQDKTMRVWDVASGKELLVLRGHEGWVLAAAFSPDGTRIVSGSEDRTVRVWDAASGDEQLVLRGHEESVYAAGFSPDGARIVSGSKDSTVRVWDAANGAELLVLRGHEGPVYAAGFSPDGARIVSGSLDDTVRLWDVASGAELMVLRGHEREVLAAAFSPDGTRIVSGSVDRTVRLWDAVSGEEQLVLRGHEGLVLAAGFSPDGTQIVSGSWDRTVRLWGDASGDELLVLRGHNRPVNTAEFSSDGARIVSGSDDGTVRLWDAQSGAELMVLRGHDGPVLAAGFSPDGARIVSGSWDSTVRLWDAASGQEVLILRDHDWQVRVAGFSPDGARIVSGSIDGTVRVWDAASGDKLLVLRGPEEGIAAAEFSPDGARIVSGSHDGTVQVWDAASGEEQLALRGHERGIVAAGFSPDGARIVSGSWDDTVRLWDAASGKELRVLRGGHEGWALSDARLSRDGARIVSGAGPILGGEDSTVRLWDAASGEEQLVLRGHEGSVLAVGFSPDGARIASGSSDGTVRVWFVGKEDAALVAHACESLPRDLSSAAIERFNLDPDAPWPCAERAQTLWPHPVETAILPAAGPERRAAPAAQ
jgi:WD40 repeat protein